MKRLQYPLMLSEGKGVTLLREIRSTMGKNCFLLEDWSGFYKANFRECDCLSIPEFPWDMSILNYPCPFSDEDRIRIRDTHFVSLGLKTLGGKPLTLARFVGVHPYGRIPHFNAGIVLDDPVSKRDIGGLRWYLTFRGIVPHSNLYSSEGQVALLHEKYPEYEAPLPIENAMMHAFYFRKHRRYLSPSRYVRCRTKTTYGEWIEIGCSDDVGIEISQSSLNDDMIDTDVGIGASRKF
ncbi:MAG: hypothetical protein NUV53_01610 [Patescibacteria group bacterium]|nr:hypothetical protein [Patescibacteria group bacterium]